VTTLALVRHGQTDWNLERRIQGSSDVPLNDTGRAQAAATGELLAGGPWQAIYASRLGRARETARIIAAATGLGDPRVLAGIEERNYGEAEGLNAEQIMARFPDDAPVPGREDPESVVARALIAIEQLAQQNADGSIIVVSHGGVIGAIVRHITGGSLPVPGNPILNGSVTELEVRDGGLHLVELNRVPSDDGLFANTLP
jgi:uncharacterized phosphatase